MAATAAEARKLESDLLGDNPSPEALHLTRALHGLNGFRQTALGGMIEDRLNAVNENARVAFKSGSSQMSMGAQVASAYFSNNMHTSAQQSVANKYGYGKPLIDAATMQNIRGDLHAKSELSAVLEEVAAETIRQAQIAKSKGETFTGLSEEAKAKFARQGEKTLLNDSTMLGRVGKRSLKVGAATGGALYGAISGITSIDQNSVRTGAILAAIAGGVAFLVAGPAAIMIAAIVGLCTGVLAKPLRNAIGWGGALGLGSHLALGRARGDASEGTKKDLGAAIENASKVAHEKAKSMGLVDATPAVQVAEQAPAVTPTVAQTEIAANANNSVEKINAAKTAISTLKDSPDKDIKKVIEKLESAFNDDGSIRNRAVISEVISKIMKKQLNGQKNTMLAAMLQSIDAGDEAAVAHMSEQMKNNPAMARMVATKAAVRPVAAAAAAKAAPVTKASPNRVQAARTAIEVFKHGSPKMQRYAAKLELMLNIAEGTVGSNRLNQGVDNVGRVMEAFNKLDNGTVPGFKTFMSDMLKGDIEAVKTSSRSYANEVSKAYRNEAAMTNARSSAAGVVTSAPFIDTTNIVNFPGAKAPAAARANDNENLRQPASKSDSYDHAASLVALGIVDAKHAKVDTAAKVNVPATEPDKRNIQV